MTKKKMQARTFSKTKLHEIHQRVSLLTMPFKIILSGDWFTVLAAALDGANPVVLAISMCGVDMTL